MIRDGIVACGVRGIKHEIIVAVQTCRCQYSFGDELESHTHTHTHTHAYARTHADW